jgi:hypothetical protein
VGLQWLASGQVAPRILGARRVKAPSLVLKVASTRAHEVVRRLRAIHLGRIGGGDLRISQTRELTGREQSIGYQKSRGREVASFGTLDLGSRHRGYSTS